MESKRQIKHNVTNKRRIERLLFTDLMCRQLKKATEGIKCFMEIKGGECKHGQGNVAF